MRERFREHMRAAVLEAAHDLIVDRGWDRVRMGEVADRAGVSRAVLYKEFGDKAGLGEAVVLREASRFLEGIQKALEAHIGDAERGIAAAVDYTLNEAERSPLLKAVLISNRDLDAGSQASTGMLPLLTTSARLLDLASDTLAGWVAESYPSLPPDDVVDAADTMVRLTESSGAAQVGPDRDGEQDLRSRRTVPLPRIVTCSSRHDRRRPRAPACLSEM